MHSEVQETGNLKIKGGKDGNALGGGRGERRLEGAFPLDGGR